MADVGRTLPPIVVQIWGIGMMTWAAFSGKVDGIPLLGVLAVAAGITAAPAFWNARKAGRGDGQ